MFSHSRVGFVTLNAPSHVHTAYRSDYFSVCLYCFIGLKKTEVRVGTKMLIYWMKERERKGRKRELRTKENILFYCGIIFISMLTLVSAMQ